MLIILRSWLVEVQTIAEIYIRPRVSLLSFFLHVSNFSRTQEVDHCQPRGLTYMIVSFYLVWVGCLQSEQKLAATFEKSNQTICIVTGAFLCGVPIFV